MLYLYHGTTSVCSQKVRLVLTEKALDWDGRILDLAAGDQFDPEYKKLNPNAVVPTLEHDGRIVIESTMINEYLDDAFPEVPLRPADPYARACMRLWTKQLDDSIHTAINAVTVAIAFRWQELEKPQEKRRYQGIPDPERRARMKGLIEEGIASPLLGSALMRLDKMLADMESALADCPWLVGSEYSLADAGFTPYVNRMDMLRLTPMWERTRPRVTDWFARIRARSNYDPAVTAFIPEARLEMMNAIGEREWPEVEAKLKVLRDALA